MSDFEQYKNGEPELIGCDLLVAQIVKYLSTLGKLHEELGTASPVFSSALKEIANRLKPYSQNPLSELPSVFDNNLKIGRKSPSKDKGASFDLPGDLGSLKPDDIESIISNPNLIKSQLVALGTIRLGIAKSKLKRLGRREIIESITAAVNHEQSLSIISEPVRIGHHEFITFHK